MQPDLPVEMAHFVKTKKTLYEWDWRALAREVAVKMVLVELNATALAEQHLLITPQHLCDLTGGRRRWTFELVKRLVSIKGGE